MAEARNRAARGLRVIDAMQAKIGAGTPLSIDDLIHLAKETKMNEPAHDTAAWRRYEQMRPRTEAAIEPGLLDDYTGAYETDDGTLSVVSRQGDTLFYRIVGQSDIAIFPESNSEFFMRLLPVQLTFRRDADGQVVGLVHHQHGFEDRADRIALEWVLAIENNVQQRIRDQKPMAESEAILRRLIEQFSRGEPDLDGMAPALVALVSEQKAGIQKELEDAGDLKALSFKGVSEGLDIYDVQFANAKTEWGFALTHRGKVSHLYLRPSL